jgi:hypothetical protein
MVHCTSSQSIAILEEIIVNNNFELPSSTSPSLSPILPTSNINTILNYNIVTALHPDTVTDNHIQSPTTC